MNRATKTEKRKREKKSVISENNVRLFSQTAKALELVVINPIIFFLPCRVGICNFATGM